MELKHEEQVRHDVIINTANLMMTAARTAPKARGIDNLTIVIVEGEGITGISEKMEEIGRREGAPAYFHRDAENILKAQALILIGTRIRSQGIQICGRCGFANCEEKDKHPIVPCTYNTGDLGIAIGSAVSIAADRRIDSRVMYTVGQAVLEMDLLGDDVKIAFGIPLSVSSKNPFFDRI
jgi:uncharacterized ferredoxin-like protein